MAIIDTPSLMIALKAGTLPRNVTRYDLLRQEVEAAVKAYCKWGIEQATATSFESGNGYVDLPLKRPFVSSITGLWQDDGGYYGKGVNAFASNTQLVEGQDFVLVLDDETMGKSGLVRRLTCAVNLFPSDLFFGRLGGLSYRRPNYWPVGYGNLKVTYTYGFSSLTMPLDIKLAVQTAVGTCINSVKWGFPVQSEGIGSHNYSLAIAREPEFGTTRQLLSRYRDLSIGAPL